MEARNPIVKFVLLANSLESKHQSAQTALLASTTIKQHKQSAHNVSRDNIKTHQIPQLAKIAQRASTCSA
jgi:2-C-methyl-D-erythritol 4-phosphate cytidylyltransferase